MTSTQCFAPWFGDNIPNSIHLVNLKAFPDGLNKRQFFVELEHFEESLTVLPVANHTGDHSVLMGAW